MSSPPVSGANGSTAGSDTQSSLLPSEDRGHKRARKPSTRYADYEPSGEMGQLLNGKTNGHPHTPGSATAGVSHITKEQQKYCQSMVRSMKRHRDGGPFLEPVDHVKLNIPDYPTIVKHPMDLSTVEKKLTAGQYVEVDDFVADLRLIFSNCYLYNGSEAVVSKMAQNLERVFNNQVHNIPNWPKSEEMVHSPGLASHAKGGSGNSGSRRALTEGRPKREVHPPSRELPSGPQYAQGHRSRTPADPQLKFCHQVIRELFKKAHQKYAYIFYEPVDWMSLNIPDYPHIVKHPMDFGTVKKKLEAGEYHNAKEFEADVRLVFHNCFIFNPPENPVHQMGRKTEEVFNRKWKELPAPAPSEPESGHHRRRSSHRPTAASPKPASDYGLEEEIEGSEDENGADPQAHDDILRFEKHLEKLYGQLEAMKRDVHKKKKPSLNRRKSSTKPSTARSSASPPAAAQGTSGVGRTKWDASRKRTQALEGESSADELDGPPRELSFAEKQELSVGI
ncbi:hypothetical protein IWQ62_005130, partial [Dispira parvispora]